MCINSLRDSFLLRPQSTHPTIKGRLRCWLSIWRLLAFSRRALSRQRATRCFWFLCCLRACPWTESLFKEARWPTPVTSKLVSLSISNDSLAALSLSLQLSRLDWVHPRPQDKPDWIEVKRREVFEGGIFEVGQSNLCVFVQISATRKKTRRLMEFWRLRWQLTSKHPLCPLIWLIWPWSIRVCPKRKCRWTPAPTPWIPRSTVLSRIWVVQSCHRYLSPLPIR